MEKIDFKNLGNFLEDGQSYFYLIIAISKIAREIVDVANDVSGTCPDDPVGEAVESLRAGRFEIIKPC